MTRTIKAKTPRSSPLPSHRSCACRQSALLCGFRPSWRRRESPCGHGARGVGRSPSANPCFWLSRAALRCSRLCLPAGFGAFAAGFLRVASAVFPARLVTRVPARVPRALARAPPTGSFVPVGLRRRRGVRPRGPRVPGRRCWPTRLSSAAGALGGPSARGSLRAAPLPSRRTRSSSPLRVCRVSTGSRGRPLGFAAGLGAFAAGFVASRSLSIRGAW